MNYEVRKDLRDRLAHAVVEAEAAFWQKVKEMFPEVKTSQDLDPKLLGCVWSALDSLVKAWAVENVPGMVEALANLREQPDEPPLDSFERDERDQT